MAKLGSSLDFMQNGDSNLLMICLNYSSQRRMPRPYVLIPYFWPILKALKYIFVSFLALCFLSFSGGVNIVKHYCGETLKEISLNKEAATCCDKHEPVSQSDLIEETCCLDQVSFLKTFEFQKKTTPFCFSPLAITVVEKTDVFNHIPFAQLSENYSLPPPKLAIFKQVQRYLI